MMQNSLKEELLKKIEEPVWEMAVMVCALAAKKERRQLKNEKYDSHVVILEQGRMGDKVYDELEIFLSLLSAGINKQTNIRFQVAIFRFKTHWLALDVNIKNGELTFFLIDSVRSSANYEILETLRNKFPNSIICNFLPEISLQKSGVGCTRFTLNTIYTLQNTNGNNLYETLNKTFDPLEKDRKVNLDTLPESLYHILRPIQDTVKIKDLPDKILDRAIKKSKQFFSYQIKMQLTMKDFFNFNLRMNLTTKKLNNTFFDYKIERYCEQMRFFFQDKNTIDIAYILSSCKGGEILRKINQEKFSNELINELENISIINDESLSSLLSSDYDRFISIFSRMTESIDEIKLANNNYLEILLKEGNDFIKKFAIEIYLDSNASSYERILEYLIDYNLLHLVEILIKKNIELSQQVFDNLPFNTYIRIFYKNDIYLKIPVEDPNQENTKNHSTNLLHFAAYFNLHECIDMILANHGSYLNEQDTNGNTPLHLAIKKNSIEVINKLLFYDPNTEIQNLQEESIRDFVEDYKFNQVKLWAKNNNFEFKIFERHEETNKIEHNNLDNLNLNKRNSNK